MARPGQVHVRPVTFLASPRHTGIKTLATHLVTNFKYLPSKENLLWAGAGGGLALAVHPFDDNVNKALVGNDTAEKIFKPGEILGELGTLLGSASVVYAVGRIKDEPKAGRHPANPAPGIPIDGRRYDDPLSSPAPQIGRSP